MDSVDSTSAFIIKTSATTFEALPVEGATLLVKLVSPGTCSEIYWELRDSHGMIVGTGSGCTITLVCEAKNISVLCACSHAVLWSGTVNVRCVEVLTVEVDYDLDSVTRHLDVARSSTEQRYKYFFTPHGGPTDIAVLRATLATDPFFTPPLLRDALKWGSVSGDGCTHIDIAVDGTDPRIVRVSRSTIGTYCLALTCCGVDSWSGKLEVFQWGSTCPTCPKPPYLSNVSPDAMLPTTSTPTGLPPTQVGIAGNDPYALATSAGPVAIDGNGYVSMSLASAEGNDFATSTLASFNSQTRVDSQAGYGFNGDFNSRLITTNRNDDSSIVLFPGDGSSLTYTTAGGGVYSTPTGANSSLQKVGSDYVETILSQNMVRTYDSNGCLKSLKRGATTWTVGQTVVQGFPLPSTITNPGGQTTTLSYKDENPPRIDSVTDYGGRKTSFFYDTKRHLQSYKTPDGAQVNLAYDANDNLTSVTLPGGEKHQYTYDSQRRLTQWKNPEAGLTTYIYTGGSRVILDPLSRRITVTSSGQFVTGVERGGATWNYNWTGNKLLSVVDPLLNSVSFSYHTAANGVSLLKSASASDGGGSIQYSYDSNDLITGVTSRTGASTTLEWNANRQRIAAINAESKRVSYTYDGNGLVSGIENLDSQSYTNVFDSHGNRTVSISPLSPRRTTFTYNGMNQVSSKKSPLENRGRPWFAAPLSAC